MLTTCGPGHVGHGGVGVHAIVQLEGDPAGGLHHPRRRLQPAQRLAVSHLKKVKFDRCFNLLYQFLNMTPDIASL